MQDSKFFQMFDVDGDGLISYTEYLLLITFLSIPVEVSCPATSQCSKSRYSMFLVFMETSIVSDLTCMATPPVY